MRYLSNELQYLEKDEESFTYNLTDKTNSLLLQKNIITSNLLEVQQEISMLLAKLQVLQQKESILQSDISEVDKQINDEHTKLLNYQSSHKTQVCK